MRPGADEVRTALREVLASRAPTLIEVPMPGALDLPPAQNVSPLPPRPRLDASARGEDQALRP